MGDMKVNNGGPAFPSDVPTGEIEMAGGINRDVYRKVSGMTLRDYFAAKAMQGLLTQDDGSIPNEQLAHIAYSIADAMSKEREK